MRVSGLHRVVGLALCSAWLLSACGGGGGNSTASPSMYSVGGTLSGLASGASVVLQASGGNDTTVSANGSFSFPTQVAGNASYAVTVLTQPTGQTCSVASGSGTVSGANVTSVRVTCAISTYTISGTVSGLNAGAPVTLQNNAGIPATVKADGSFSFAIPVPYHGSYAVSVLVQPPAQACTVTAGTGFGVSANITGVSVACVAASESVIYSFDANPDGTGPQAQAIQGSDGNFYGTTYTGGTSGLGTVFKITPAGVETLLHSFTGGDADGSFPTAALIQGSDGNFYGTTANGGPSGEGTVFRITPTGVETIIHAFTGFDGISPSAALIQGSDGNFYGTTSGGNGNVFQITPAGATTILHSFAGGSTDGRVPTAALIQSSDGNFYGTTAYGGTSDAGTVFVMTPLGVVTVLHSFTSASDGSTPGALLQGSDGNFYGTTAYGGAGNDGTVFRITPAGVLTVLHLFAGAPSDGSHSTAGLLEGSDGAFYGTTQTGGADNNGTVFRITPAGVETVLHSFMAGLPEGSADGSRPDAALIQGNNGSFYDTTQAGGSSGLGALFKITSSGVEAIVYSFGSGPEGRNPTGLIEASDGNFYGTTFFGGTQNAGMVFKITRAGVETQLHSFTGGTADGASPSGSLVQGSDGNFYGTTQVGGASGMGTVFMITPAGVETVLHSFSGGSDGSSPRAALIQAKDGNFYGTTAGGGSGNNGTAFKITPAGVETVLHAFTNGSDGGTPEAALVQGADGSFYGTTYQGGSSDLGTVFKMTATGAETVLHSFSGSPDGSFPPGALIQGTDGNFYGTTPSGGSHLSGTVFKITPSGVETTLYSFVGDSTDGSQPTAPLIQGDDGKFYGTAGGGVGGGGTVFTMTATGVETVIYSFGTTVGGGPPDSMILGSDGIFYGTTYSGGTSNLGTVFKF